MMIHHIPNILLDVVEYVYNHSLVINHVRYRSQVCKTNTILGGPLISEQQADDIDKELQKQNRALRVSSHRRHSAKEPAFRLQGSLIKIVCPNPSNHHILGVGALIIIKLSASFVLMFYSLGLG